MQPKYYNRLLPALFLLFSFSITYSQTTTVEFRYNMNFQIDQGWFNPSTETMDIAGSFNNWGDPVTQLSDGDNDGIYTRSFTLTVGETIEFKGRINGAWNNREEFPGGGPNRSYTVTANGVVELWYNDQLPPNTLDVNIYSSSVFIEPGSSVQFIDQSVGNPVAWQWSFPGGSPATSTEENPVVSYASAGNYAVSLSITDAANSTASKSFSNFIRVGETQTRWWNNTIFYEVFVRSFKDSDGDGKGDIQGLINKLDYLNDGDPNTDTDLGVTGIWLMPIQQSPSYHGYDATDYRTIEQDYGTNADFTALIEAAHSRGIKVIVDLVMNHTSEQHPWFIESTNPASSKRNWYRWSSTNPGTQGPWGQTLWHNRNGNYYYGIFWSGMPDLNYATPAVKSEMFDVARFWLEEMNVDGFRLDAVKYIDEDGNQVEDTPETIQFWKDFRTYYNSIDPDAFSVGEAWTSTSKIQPYVNDGGLDYCFEFDLASSMLYTVNNGNTNGLSQKITEVMKAYPYLQFGTFLTNHDQDRIMNVLGSNVSKAKLAADLLLTLPGIPYLYYGEEIGMTGAKPDENIRTPLHWNDEAQGGFTTGTPWYRLNGDYATKNIEAQQADPNSLWQHYRQLISLRNEQAALRQGNYKSILASNQASLAFLRQYGNENIIVVSNVSNGTLTNVSLTLNYGEIAPGNYSMVELQGGNTLSVNINTTGGFSDLTIDQIPARTTLIYRLTSTTSTSQVIKPYNLDLYPNPAKEQLSVSLSENVQEEIPYQIVDVLGRTINRGIIDTSLKNIQLGDTAPGIYLFVLEGEKGRLAKWFVVE